MGYKVEVGEKENIKYYASFYVESYNNYETQSTL